MKKPAALVGVCAIATLVAACGGNGIVEPTATSGAIVIGSGRFVTESRRAEGFTAIAVAAGRVVVTRGSVESLEITAEDNILPLIESTVINGRLTLGLRSGSGATNVHGVEYRITMRDLREIHAGGASRIDANGIEASHLIVNLSGASTFSGSGSVNRMDLNLSGASRVQAPELTAHTATAMLSGASVALVRVTDSLVVHASGASVVEFLGDPAVEAETSGGSIVRRAGSR